MGRRKKHTHTQSFKGVSDLPGISERKATGRSSRLPQRPLGDGGMIQKRRVLCPSYTAGKAYDTQAQRDSTRAAKPTNHCFGRYHYFGEP